MSSLVNKKFVKNFFVSIILIILLNKVIEVFITFDNYISLNELFINYEGGFLRRGLLGQIAFYLFQNFSINPLNFFSFIFSLANFIFFILFLKSIEKFKNNVFLYFLLLLSPATLMFSIFDSINFFHNQIFMLIIILLHSFIAHRYVNQITKYKKFVLFLILPLITLSIFQYDPQILTLSSHIFITFYVISKSSPRSFNFLFYYLILAVPIFFILMNTGSIEQVTAEKMKKIVIENYHFIMNAHPESFLTINSNDLGGNLNLKFGAMIKIFGIIFDYNNKVYLFGALLLTIIFFIIIFGYFINKKIYYLQIEYKYLIFSLIPLLSLFLFITDFGRSIHIFLIHLLSMFFLFELNDQNEKKFINKINFLKKALYIIILIIYCNFWTLSHVAGWVTLFNPKSPNSKYSSYTNEFKKISFNIYYYTDKNLIRLPKAEFMKRYLK